MTAASDPSDLEQRALHSRDAASLCALSDAAGWNQTEDDWRLMLARGEGFGYWRGDAAIASALILPYGTEFAWLSMVLVAEPWRRQGLASRLTEACLSRARTLGLALRLDATTAGRAVYQRFGFTDQHTFTRFAAERPVVAKSHEKYVRAATEGDLNVLAAYDRAAFGAGREAILAALLRRRPALAWIADANGTCKGSVFGRDGHRAVQLGPVAAADAQTAIALATAALQDVDEPAFVDAIDGRTDFLAWLAKAGFTAQRQFTRMSLGGPRLTPPKNCFVVAGPEYG